MIFLLEHRHDRGTLAEPDVDTKLIGWFSTVQGAVQARDQVRQLDGFRDHPFDFYIRPIDLDLDLL